MADRPTSEGGVVRLRAESGICGFSSVIEARRTGRYTVSIGICSSECRHVVMLGGFVREIRMKELFSAAPGNPVFLAAQRAGCHASCPVPVAVLKAAEVAMEMALPRDVKITFEP